jgi:hypothetical protein
LCVGPLMLPMVWLNPRMSQKVKIITSAVVIILTLLLGALFVGSLKAIMGYYKIIFSGGSLNL